MLVKVVTNIACLGRQETTRHTPLGRIGGKTGDIRRDLRTSKVPNSQTDGLIPQESKDPPAGIVETETKGTRISVRECTAGIGVLCAVAIGAQGMPCILCGGGRVDRARLIVATMQCHLVVGLVIDTLYDVDLATVRPVGADRLYSNRELNVLFMTN